MECELEKEGSMHDDNESFVLFRLFVIGLECIWYFRENSFTILYDLECRLQQFHRVQRFQISYCIEIYGKWKRPAQNLYKNLNNLIVISTIEILCY